MAEEWFIAKNGAPIGPLTEEELHALHVRGDVELDCLVWRQGMAGWIPFEAQFPGGTPPAPEPAPVPVAPVVVPEEPVVVVPKPAAGSLQAAMNSAKIVVAKSHAPAHSEVERAAEAPRWGGSDSAVSSVRITPVALKNVSGVTGKSKVSIAKASEGEDNDLRPWVTSGSTQDAGEGAESVEVSPPLNAPSGPSWNGSSSGLKMEGMPEDDQPIPPRTPEPAPVVHAASYEPKQSNMFNLRHFPGIERLNPALLRPAMFSTGSMGYGPIKLADSPTGQAAVAVCSECGKTYQEGHVNNVGGRRICKLCQQSVKEKLKKEIERKANFRWFGGPMERAIYGGVFVGVLIGGLYLAMRLVGFSFTGKSATSKEIGYTEVLPPTRWAAKPTSEWPQIALANYAEFADTSTLTRGSSFLVKSQSGQVIGVSSMVNLRADHGVYPPVNPLFMNLTMAPWKMYVAGDQEKAVHMQSLLTDPLAYVGTPVVYLEGKISFFGVPAQPLKLQKLTLPDNAPISIVIPDSSPTTGPKQRVLKGNIRPSTSSNGQSVQIQLSEVVGSGMPLVGAPVLNEAGHVIAVCIGLSPFKDIWSPPDGKGEILPVNTAQFQPGYIPEVPPDSDLVYAADIRGFPRSYER